MVRFESQTYLLVEVEVDGFTFQYGAIWIDTDKFIYKNEDLFTFQYGAIWICIVSELDTAYHAFTFQYGAIWIGVYAQSAIETG